MKHDLSHIELTNLGLAAIYYIKNKKVAVKIKNPFPYLRYRFEVEKGATLRPLFEYVRDNEKLKHFIEMYSNVRDIDAHHDQLDGECKNKEDEWVVSEKSVVYWGADRYNCEYKNKIEFNLYAGFGTKGYYNKDDSYFKKGDKTNISVSASPLCEFCDLPFVLDKTILGVDYNSQSWGRYFGLPDVKGAFGDLGEMDFTFLDVLDAIYYDISFYGTPDQAKEFIEEINDRKKSIEEKEELTEEEKKELEEEETEDYEDFFDRLKKECENRTSYMMKELGKMTKLPVMKIYDSLDDFE